MVGSMRSSDSTAAGGNNSGLGGPNSNNSGNSSSSSKGGSSGGGLNSAGNRASGAGPGASSNRSTTGGGFGSGGGTPSGSVGGQVGGGLNAAGNRASGAGPGASSNRSTTGGGFGSSGGTAGNNNANGGGNASGLNSAGNRASGAGPGASSNRTTSGNNGGLNSAGNRASGAGPGASANRSTTGGGFGTPTGGGMVNDAEHRADMAQQARAAETKSMKDLARERALGVISAAEGGTVDPYSTLSGGQVTANLSTMTVREAVTLAKTTWNGKLANVLGAFQFKDTTLAAVAQKMGLLDAKMTPQVQDQLAVGLMQQRANRATVNGQIDVDKFANELAKEWASLATTTGVSHFAKNGIDKASVSFATVHEIAKELVANGVVSPAKSVSSVTPKDVSSFATQTPGVSRFSATFMGGISTTAPAKNNPTQNDPSGLPAGTYPGHVVGNGISPTFAAPNQQTAAKPQQNDPSSLPPGTYPAFDPSGLPPAKPASRPTPTAATPAKPTQPRSLGQKVAAGAIDAGLGMLPGVGTAVSVVNGGLALTGNRTLGEHVVDSFLSGEGGAGPYSGGDRLGGGNTKQIVDNKSKSTVPKEGESFEERYLAFVDPTPRPKPGERWNYDTAGYA